MTVAEVRTKRVVLCPHCEWSEMSKLTDSLRKVGVYNPCNFFSRVDEVGKKKVSPYICYLVEHNSRSPFGNRWAVVLQGKDLTDGKGHWHDNGAKCFSVLGKQAREERLREAIKWASERFNVPVEHWVKSPFKMVYGVDGFIEQRLTELKAKVEKLSKGSEGVSEES